MDEMLNGTGQALRLLRVENGQKQSEVAQRAGMLASQVSRYEAGMMLPNLHTLARILRALDRDFSDFGAALRRVDGSMGKPARGSTVPRMFVMIELPGEVSEEQRAALATLTAGSLPASTTASEARKQ